MISAFTWHNQSCTVIEKIYKKKGYLCNSSLKQYHVLGRTAPAKNVADPI